MDATSFCEVPGHTYQPFIVGRQEVLLSTVDSSAYPFEVRRRYRVCDGVFSLDAGVAQVMAAGDGCGEEIIETPAGQDDKFSDWYVLQLS